MDKLGEIRRLYYETSRATIRRDFSRAIEILRSMASEEERERAAVFMDGLSQMRSEWSARGDTRFRRTGGRAPAKRH